MNEQVKVIRDKIEQLKLDYLNRSYTFVPKAMQDLLDFIDSLSDRISPWDEVDVNTAIKVKVKETGEVICGFYDGKGHFDHFVDHDVFDRYSIDEVELTNAESL